MAINHFRNLKIIYVLLDGIGDLPHPDLNGLTPLEAAKTPNMDKLAKKGVMGNVLSVGKGIAPQSDIAVFNMLGYNFKKDRYVGRGVIEIMGCDTEFREGDLALRGNFATVDHVGHILDRRAGRSIGKNEAKDLCNFLEKNIKFSDPNVSVKLIHTIAHRVIVRLRHSKIALSDKISNTDPAYDRINGMGIASNLTNSLKIRRCVAEENNNSSLLSARFVNEFTKQCTELADDHQVNINRRKVGKKSMNMILLRDPGTRIPTLQSMYQKYGIRASCIVDMPVEIGIAKALGIECISTGKINDYELKAHETMKLIETFDLVYVHLKGPDEYGHDGNALGKKANVENIDRNYFGTLLDYSSFSRTLVVISGDHSTPCTKKAHTDDPVPLLLSAKGIDNDGSKRFTEECASQGSLGLLIGVDVLNTTIKIINSC